MKLFLQNAYALTHSFGVVRNLVILTGWSRLRSGQKPESINRTLLLAGKSRSRRCFQVHRSTVNNSVVQCFVCELQNSDIYAYFTD